MDEKLKDIGVDLIDEFFPKGECKERGEAMVLYAKLLIKFEEYLLADRRRICAPAIGLKLCNGGSSYEELCQALEKIRGKEA